MGKNRKSKPLIKLDTIRIFFGLISQGAISAMTGFGFFWYARLLDYGVFWSMLIGMFISAIVMAALRLGGK